MKPLDSIKSIYTKQILKEAVSDASLENIGDSLYTFLEKLQSKYPQEKDTITHWLLIIDETVQEVDNLATADMSPEEAEQATDEVLTSLRSLIKHQ